MGDEDPDDSRSVVVPLRTRSRCSTNQSTGTIIQTSRTLHGIQTRTFSPSSLQMASSSSVLIFFLPSILIYSRNHYSRPLSYITLLKRPLVTHARHLPTVSATSQKTAANAEVLPTLWMTFSDHNQKTRNLTSLKTTTVLDMLTD